MQLSRRKKRSCCFSSSTTTKKIATTKIVTTTQATATATRTRISSSKWVGLLGILQVTQVLLLLSAPIHTEGFTIPSPSIQSQQQYRSTTTTTAWGPLMLLSSGNNNKKNNLHNSNSFQSRDLATTATTARSPSSSSSRSLCQLHAVRLTMHPHANLAVTIDQPLLPRANSKFAKSLLAFLMSDAVKAATITFCVAMIVTIVIKSAALKKQMAGVSKFLKGLMLRIGDGLFQRANKEGVPMTFDDTENDGWGVCTLRSKKKLGRTSFVQYDFDLPKSNQVIPLKLGQQAALCCLDNSGSVAKGDFFIYHPQVNAMLGRFAIVAPNKGALDNEYDVGSDAANFVRVLKNDLKVGDEIAVKPGSRKLEYRGQHFPVTDMVYIASGVGIVPILEQVRAVLPNGSSSVKSVTVVWIDENSDDFDVISDHLEREYYKYTTKLAVSCVVDNLRANTLADNYSIVNAIPEFIPGTMAVLSGPKPVQRKATNYLLSRGYPTDVICEL